MHTLPFVDRIDEDALLELLRLRLASQRHWHGTDRHNTTHRNPGPCSTATSGMR